MKRLFPAPWLSLALWLLWLVLNLSLSAGNLLLGAALGFLAPIMFAPLRPLPIHIHRPGVILKLFFLVGRDVIVSNIAVAWGVLNAGKRHVKTLPDHWTVVTRDGSLSAQWEHMVAVTDNGFEVLSPWPDTMADYPATV